MVIMAANARPGLRARGIVQRARHEDGEIEDTRQLRRDVTRTICRCRPDLISDESGRHAISVPGRDLVARRGGHANPGATVQAGRHILKD